MPATPSAHTRVHVASDLPMRPEDITAPWLGTALSLGSGLDVTVTEAVIDHIVWGTTTKVLISATYDRPTELPRHLCVKGGFDADVRNLSATEILVMEARFYGNLSQRYHTSAPNSFYAGVSSDGDQGIVIMEDLASAGARFLEPGDTMAVDQVAAALARQARWHAATWGLGNADLGDVPIGSQTRHAVKFFFREPNWSEHFSRSGAPALPQDLQDCGVLYRAYQKLWRLDDASVHCLLHGDAHVGNTFLDTTGDPHFVDWQCYCRGPWAYDVGYFVSGALDVANRRAREADLLRHYLAELHGHGGPAIPWDEAWRDYGRHQLHGLLWSVTPAAMQPLERSRTMSERHVTACLDHEALALVAAG
jgi:hypothetical protein